MVNPSANKLSFNLYSLITSPSKFVFNILDLL